MWEEASPFLLTYLTECSEKRVAPGEILRYHWFMRRCGFPFIVPLIAVTVFAVSILSGCVTKPSVDPRIVAAMAAHNVSGRTATKIQTGQSLDYRDIVYLVRAKVPTAIIIAYLRSTEKSYQFTPGQLDTLRNLGASSQLINYLNETKGFYAMSGTSRPPSQANLKRLRAKSRSFLSPTQSFLDEVTDPAYEESLFSPFYLHPKKS
ncbi:MAG: hypothetical protein C5B47_00500 [Verrucomicrobia bacterium]|nr:MAG: hypothetical protein C5B47_00500 [Verrucomicrobiota bacterium]